MQAKRNLLSVVSGILMIVVTLFKISVSMRCFTSLADFGWMWSNFITAIEPVFYIALAVALLMNNRKVAIASYTGIAITEVVLMIIIGIEWHWIRLNYNWGLIHFIFGPWVNSIISFAVEGVMIFMLLASTILSEETGKKILKYIWFVPATIYFLFSNYNLLLGLFGWFPGIIPSLEFIVTFLSYLTLGLWALAIYVPKVKKSEIKECGSFKAVSGTEGYCDLVVHILLLLFTFGIWHYIWIYKTTSYLNNTPGEEHRNPTTKLLLCMFVPFYYIYWTYKSAQRIDKLALSKGQSSDISTLCLILSIFVGIVPPIIMQDKINNIVRTKSNIDTANNSESSSTQAAQPVIGIADELKKYKDLLDSGVITQEEFEAKKKELLGL